MKKITTLCLSLLFAATAFAQNEGGTLSLQPKVGLNVSSIVSGSESLDPKAGLTFGLELDYRINRLISLTFGTLYSQQGAKENYSGADFNFELNYINVPTLVNFHLAKGLALKSGLQFGFLVNEIVHIKVGGEQVDMGLEEAARKVPGGEYATLRKFDLSIPFGISYEFSGIMIEARYCGGIIPIYGHAPGTDRNSVLQFSVGYNFKL